MDRFYAGIGSRETPSSVLVIMKQLATKLEKLGFTLRSGGADGADSAFAAGCKHKRIYLAHEATPAAIKIASDFHPAWNRCSEYARKLHGRNSFQILGDKLDTPASFVICWTRDGAINNSQRSIATGGTGTAISIANHYKIPVFNLAVSAHLSRIKKFLSE